MTISNELLDELLKGCKRPEDLVGDAGLMKELKVRLMERMLGAELTAHLGYDAGAEPPPEQTNRRNGVATKRVKGSDGEVPLVVPRDREGSFEPQLVKKGQTRIDGVDDKIIGLYAAGLSVRDIQAHLEDLYGLKVSPDLISRVTDAVLSEVREWQHRALDRMYPIVIFDALRVKIRDADSRMVRNKAVYIALGVTRDGEREVLGLWIADTEGAKFWLSVMNELRNRGVQDILIAVVDGLKGFPDAITAAFPETMVQTCIVHLIRHSMNFCSWKDRKTRSSGKQSPGLFSDPPHTADLRPIYEASTADEAARQLDAFEGKWAGKYPSIAPAWRRAWAEVTPFYAFSAAIRKIIYTTNAVESLNRVLRKTLKTKCSFPTEEAATKLIFLAIRNFEKGGRAVREWVAARNQLAIMFTGRFDA
jgi:putative transposase